MIYSQQTVKKGEICKDRRPEHREEGTVLFSVLVDMAILSNSSAWAESYDVETKAAQQHFSTRNHLAFFC